ncbi:hypothetical protein PLEOSDRAFT_1081132 [Pleurotus ostreatus PC15]|uniref:Phosducin domain-containing protein n=1 Tax=Pleurotus ostreatus (strain PC15) TaxID=1137138 RepID=A0A067P4N3_PLEO1|nr:hypothetical protein PLEOSDRAFT_1081132 [Pleurotus ostreatus PC15]
MMNADIEALVLSGELFNPTSSRSSSPRRSPSPDSGWHDELLESDSDSNSGREKTADVPQESIGMGPGRTGVKGVIKDRDEANDIQRNQSQASAREKALQWERGDLGGRTYLEEEREKAYRNELYDLGEKVDRLVLEEQEKERGRRSGLDLFGGAKRGRFGHLREVGVKGFVNAVEKEGRGIWVVVHLYDPSLERCYLLDSALSHLARIHPETKFIRARASKLGFTSSSKSTVIHSRRKSSQRIRTSSTLNTIDSDDEDPYGDEDATSSRLKDNNIRHGSYNDAGDEDGDIYEDEDEEEDVDLDMLPTMLVYRDGELVHNWVRVDWVAKDPSGSGGAAGITGKFVEDLLENHHILPRDTAYGVKTGDDSGELVFSNNLGLPSDDDEDEFLWSD